MQSEYWWDADRSVVGQQIAGTIVDIATKNDAVRRRKLVAWRALYMDLPYEYFGDAEIGVWRTTRRSNYNVLQGCVDATHARIVTQRPRPQVLTVAGRWKLQRKAKLLQRWLDGEYERLRVFDRLSSLVKDALIYGTGLLKVYEKDGKCALDRVWCGDLFVDPREERFDSVMSLYQLSGCDRGVLKARFPQHAKAIDEAPRQIDDVMFPDMRLQGYATPDLATVVEAWRRPTGDKPGRRVLCCGNAVLDDQEWTFDGFPFIRFRWSEDPERWWGQGMIERGAGIQSDLSEHTSIVRESYETFVPKLAIQTGSKVSIETMDDEIGKAVYYDGVMPQVLSPTPIAPDFLRREDMFVERVYRVLGVSELSAASQKPAGINSGKGMLVYQDTETQRFLPQGRGYERASLDCADLLIHTARTIAARGETESLVVYGGKSGLEIAKFDEAMFDPDQDEVYQLRTWPVSSLSNSITGKLEEVERLVQVASITDPKQIQQLLDIPDIEQYQDISMAKRDAVDRQIDMCLDGEQGIPSTYMDLAYAVDRGDLEVCHSEIDGAPEEILELLRNFCGAARSLMEQQAGMGMQGDVPGPEGLGDPTNEMMPMEAPMADQMGPAIAGAAPVPMPPQGGGMPV